MGSPNAGNSAGWWKARTAEIPALVRVRTLTECAWYSASSPADVERERRLPVRRRLDQDPSVRTGPHLRVQEPQYVATSAEPGRDRRHLPPGVRGEQSLQRDQILALHGRRELIEHRPPDWLVRLAEVLFARPEPRQLGPRPLQRAVDGRGRGVEQGRDLGRRPGQHLTQDQYGALARWKVLHRGDHRQPEALPIADHRGRVGAEQLVRERLQPRHLECLRHAARPDRCRGHRARTGPSAGCCAAGS